MLLTYALGYYPRTDTLTVHANQYLAVRLAMMEFYTGLTNVYNCRPRGFRRHGESACVTTGMDAEFAFRYALDLARPERGSVFNLPAVRTGKVELIRDESTCRKAARLYGRPDDPPRRVIVVRMDTVYMVYDPFEPAWAGEWTVYSFFDRNWRWIVHILT